MKNEYFNQHLKKMYQTSFKFSSTFSKKLMLEKLRNIQKINRNRRKKKRIMFISKKLLQIKFDSMMISFFVYRYTTFAYYVIVIIQ